MLSFDFDLICKNRKPDHYLIIVQHVSNSVKTGAVESIYLSELVVGDQEGYAKKMLKNKSQETYLWGTRSQLNL